MLDFDLVPRTMIINCQCRESTCQAKSHRFSEISNPQIWVAAEGVPFPQVDETPGPEWKRVQAPCTNDKSGGFMWNGVCGPCINEGTKARTRQLIEDEDD